MKIYVLLPMFAFITHNLNAQLRIDNGLQWVNSGAVVITVDNLDLVNDGTFSSGGSLVKFSGNTNTNISGSASINFNEIQIAKAVNNKLLLLKNTSVQNRVIFTSGLLDLNQHNLDLAATAYLDNESALSRIIGPAGGEVTINPILNAPVQNNPGNLGAILTSQANMGAVLIKRGHKAQSGNGLVTSINRYFDIAPANNSGLNATLLYQYFDTELNSQTENSLDLYRSIDGGINWTNQGFTTRDINLNYVEKTGINDFSRWTLSSGTALPQPDYTPINTFQGLNFPAAGYQRDFIISLVNINNMPSLANPVTPLEFRVIKSVSFSFSFNPAAVLINGTAVQNSDWIIDNSNASYVRFMLKNTASIPSNGYSAVGLTITRNQNVASNTTGNITVVIVNTSGGDSNNGNNTVVTQVVAL